MGKKYVQIPGANRPIWISLVQTLINNLLILGLALAVIYFLKLDKSIITPTIVIISVRTLFQIATSFISKDANKPKNKFSNRKEKKEQ